MANTIVRQHGVYRRRVPCRNGRPVRRCRGAGLRRRLWRSVIRVQQRRARRISGRLSIPTVAGPSACLRATTSRWAIFIVGPELGWTSEADADDNGFYTNYAASDIIDLRLRAGTTFGNTMVYGAVGFARATGTKGPFSRYAQRLQHRGWPGGQRGAQMCSSVRISRGAISTRTSSISDNGHPDDCGRADRFPVLNAATKDQ